MMVYFVVVTQTFRIYDAFSLVVNLVNYKHIAPTAL